jgi:hypothetical protein
VESHADHHLGVVIAGDATILQAVDARSGKLFESSGSLRIFLLEISHNIFHRQGRDLDGGCGLVRLLRLRRGVEQKKTIQRQEEGSLRSTTHLDTLHIPSFTSL